MPAPTRKCFRYDEETQKWEPFVTGTRDSTEAKQAFNAVVLTVQELNPVLLSETRVKKQDNSLIHLILPAV